MRDETPQRATSSRTLLLRELGGQDNAAATENSDNSFYRLLNLRPTRGALTQTKLITPLIDEIAT